MARTPSTPDAPPSAPSPEHPGTARVAPGPATVPSFLLAEGLGVDAAKAALMALPARIRWDRVGRFALLLVLAAILLLYVSPLASWWSTWRESKARQAEVAALRQENAELRARRDELRDPEALELEARERGMVGRDERAYVVRGLPRR